MSVMGIIGLIWLGFGLITVAIAVRQKLPLILWIIAALLLGPYSLFWVAAAIARKRRLPPYDGGPLPMGAVGPTAGVVLELERPVDYTRQNTIQNQPGAPHPEVQR